MVWFFFVGMIPKGGPGTEKMETYVLNLRNLLQLTGISVTMSFFLEPLEYMIEERETYGLAVIDRKKKLQIATLRGKKSKYF